MTIKPSLKVIVKKVVPHLIFSVILLLPLLWTFLDPASRGGAVVAGVVILAVIWFVVFPIVALQLTRVSYHIKDTRIVVCSGIFTKTRQNIPYAKITDFKLVRSPLDRLLGMASLAIQTAGQSTLGYEAHFVGLTDWEGVLDTVRAKIEGRNNPAFAARRPESAGQSPEVLGEILEELRRIRGLLEKERN